MSDGRVAEDRALSDGAVRDVRPPAARPPVPRVQRRVSVLLDLALLNNDLAWSSHGSYVRGYASTELAWPRVWVSYASRSGERKARAAGIERRRVLDVFPKCTDRRQPDRRAWFYDFEEDVRERLFEELRPGVVAMWADPLERLGVR